MTKGTRHVNGHYYAAPHPGWGGFSDELFHYTSRYYGVTESFLRHLAEMPAFSMSGYKASRLGGRQRQVMAGILTCKPDKQTAQQVISIIIKVIGGSVQVDDELLARFGSAVSIAHDDDMIGHVPTVHKLEMSPLEPWLNLAERLNLAVAVHDHRVEMDMKMLAQYLDSPNSTLRANLLQGIIDLHEAGYVVKNHPHLTHREARVIGGDGAV